MSTTNKMNHNMSALLDKLNRSQLPQADPQTVTPQQPIETPVAETDVEDTAPKNGSKKVTVPQKPRKPVDVAGMDLEQYCERFLSNRTPISEVGGTSRVLLDLQNTMDLKFICDCTQPHTSVTSFVNQILRLHIQEYKPLLRQLYRPRVSWEERRRSV